MILVSFHSWFCVVAHQQCKREKRVRTAPQRAHRAQEYLETPDNLVIPVRASASRRSTQK